jgi:hypothetical protein
VMPRRVSHQTIAVGRSSVKQAAFFGWKKKRGLDALVMTLSRLADSSPQAVYLPKSQPCALKIIALEVGPFCGVSLLF